MMKPAMNADIIRAVGSAICGLGDVLIDLADTDSGPAAIAGLKHEMQQLKSDIDKLEERGLAE